MKASTITKKQQISQKLGSLLSGATNSLAAMLHPDAGKTVTDPAEMAALLDKRWGKVLSAKPTDFSRLLEWLSTIQANLPPLGFPRWEIAENHIVP